MKAEQFPEGSTKDSNSQEEERIEVSSTQIVRLLEHNEHDSQSRLVEAHH